MSSARGPELERQPAGCLPSTFHGLRGRPRPRLRHRHRVVFRAWLWMPVDSLVQVCLLGAAVATLIRTVRRQAAKGDH